MTRPVIDDEILRSWFDVALLFEIRNKRRMY